MEPIDDEMIKKEIKGISKTIDEIMKKVAEYDQSEQTELKQNQTGAE